MKSYYPYAPTTPRLISGEEHRIENGQILLNHIPYLNSIEIDGFTQTSSVNILPKQFYCNYGAEYYYRESNCIVKFHQQHNGQVVRVTYQQVGTIITANDMNEVKAHIEDNSIHNCYELPVASSSTRGGIRVGRGLNMLGDILSADAQNYTLPSATNARLGGVVVESDANIARTIERYFPSTGETLPVHVQEIATRDSAGVVKIGDGLSITEDGLLSADAQNFTLTPATTDSLGGVKIGSGLSIDANGLLSADTVAPYMLPIAARDSLGGVKVGSRLSIDTNGILSADSLQTATTSRLGGVVVESDANIARTIERYFPSVTADTEILPVLSSIPAATRDSIGGVIIGNGLSIDSLGVLSADAQDFTLTPATRDSLGGVKIGARLSIDSLGVLSADTVETYTLTAATNNLLGGVFVESDENISRTIQRYFPTVGADEIVPVLTSIPVATNETLGGVKIGEGLSITEDGILSADAQNFTLTPATSDSLGGVKVGDGLSITGGGVLSALAQNFTLNPATTDSLGGVTFARDTDISAIINEYFPTVDSGEIIPVLTSIPPATRDSLGGVKIGDGLSITEEGLLTADAQNFTLTPATTDSLGGVMFLTDEDVESMIESYFGVGSTDTTSPTIIGGDSGYILPIATAEKLGGVKIGARLSITADGILSADSVAPYTLPAASDEEISSMIDEYFPETLMPEPFTLPAATKYSLGGIIVGDRLSISNSGVLSANDQSYTLPTASASTKGGIKIGKGLTMTGETLSANADNYTLPTASASQLGGVKVGNTLSMSSSGVLNYNLPNATSAALGGVIAGNTLTITNGTLNYNLPTASASQLGGVKVGDGLTITNGVLTATATNYTLPVASDEEISAIIQNYFAYTVVGGV